MDRVLTSLLLLHCFNFLQVFAAPVQCSREGAVFIQASSSSTNSSTVGRVQYCLRPSSGGGSLFWAVVRNSTFQLNEAHVACRTNNSTYAAYTILPGADFSQTDLTYQVEVQCSGYERSMAECNVTEVPSSTYKDFVSAAGVSCNTREVENSVILVGSASDTEGYVMIYRSGWRFLVTQPSHWTDTHAQVVCRQLGYEGGVVPSNTNGYSQPTDLVPYQANLDCLPSARDLGECTNAQMFLPSPMLAAVSCSLSGDADGSVRLSGRSTDGENEGVLEIVFNGRYGSVCSSGFGSKEANVACRQLGYASGSGRASVNVFPSRPQYLSGLDCSGTESSLLECAFDSPLGTVCDSRAGVRVFCSIHSGTDVRGPDKDEGEGLSGAAVAGIVISVTILVTSTILCSIYLIRIKAKLVEVIKRRRQRTKVTVSSADPSMSYPTMVVEMQRTHLQSLVLESEPTTAPESAASSQYAAEPQEPQNPQLSAEAPPSYRDADQFQLVTEEDASDLEKPPPYMDLVPMGGAAYALPVVSSYLPTGLAYPPMYPPTGSAYPPAYLPIVLTSPPPPPSPPPPSPPPPSPYAYTTMRLQ